MINKITGERGSSLIEVLIALLLLSIGASTIGTLCIQSLSFRQDSAWWEHATQIAFSVSENLRLHKHHKYKKEQVLPSILLHWREKIAKALPGSELSIEYTEEKSYTLTIFSRMNVKYKLQWIIDV